MPRRLVAALVIAAWLLGYGLAYGADAGADSTVTTTRPRIGLALSGGGARGAAHIGVLKVLDELRIPISCVAGTSMGSIVGGAFAAGTTPSEMEAIITKVDWNDVFTDRPPRAEISTRRKEDDYKSLFAPEFGLRDSTLLVPKGVVAGVSIESFLRSLTAKAGTIQNFQQLPIPFRAVATDITTGQEVVLDHGSLPGALRASMSIPGAMAPVEIDRRLLVDGGIANNLPIDLVRKMCGDVIIAVNISTPALKRQDITSALSVVGQLINFLGKDAVDKQIASLTERDVLIQPDLGDISSGSFDRVGDAIKIGEATARKQADQLARYSIPEEEYRVLRIAQTSAPATSLGKVDEIRFEGLERTTPEVLSQLMDSKPGTELTEETLGKDLRRIYGRGDFEAVDYRIEQGPGARALVIHVHEKETGPDYLRFGVALASDLKNGSYFNALASYRAAWLNRLGAEWMLEGQVGQNSYLYTEFYQPVERYGYAFVAPYAQTGVSYRPAYNNNDRFADYRVRETRIGLDVGAALGTFAEVRLGPLWRDVNANVQTGSPLLPTVQSNPSGMRLKIFADRLDSPWFSRDGYRVSASLFSAMSSLGADTPYSRGELSWVGAKSFGRHTFSLNLYGGTDFGTGMPAYDSFVLGGPFRLSAYAINQFAGRDALFGSLRYYNRIQALPSPLGSGLYAGASLEMGRMDGQFVGPYSTGTLYSLAGFIGADTFLGPVWLGFGLAPAGNKSVFFALGVP